jgi:hypothetical protein
MTLESGVEYIVWREKDSKVRIKYQAKSGKVTNTIEKLLVQGPRLTKDVDLFVGRSQMRPKRKAKMAKSNNR